MRRMRLVGWRGVRFSGVGISGSFVFVVDDFFFFSLFFFYVCGIVGLHVGCGGGGSVVMKRCMSCAGGGICNCG